MALPQELVHQMEPDESGAAEDKCAHAISSLDSARSTLSYRHCIPGKRGSQWLTVPTRMLPMASSLCNPAMGLANRLLGSAGSPQPLRNFAREGSFF